MGPGHCYTSSDCTSNPRNWPSVALPLQSSLYAPSSPESSPLPSSLPVCVLSCPAASDSLWPPWTVAHKSPVFTEFSRQEYWSGFPFPTSGDLLDPRVEPVSLASPALAGRYTTAPPGKPPPTIPTYKVLVTRPALLLLLSSHTGFLRVPSLPTPSCLEPFLCLLPPLQMPFHLTFRGPPPSWDSDSSSEEASSEVPHLTSHSAAPTWCLCVTLLNSLQSNLIFFLSVNLLLLKSVQSIFISHFLFLNLQTCSTGNCLPVTLKSILSVFLHSSLDKHRAATVLGWPRHTFPAGVQQGHALLSCFRSHRAN